MNRLLLSSALLLGVKVMLKNGRAAERAFAAVVDPAVWYKAGTFATEAQKPLN
jgi:hypothetical protein